MRVIRLALLVGVLVVLGGVPAHAFCVVFSSTTTPNTEVYDMEITGSAGNLFTLALFERINGRAAHGTAVTRGSTVAMSITRPGGTAIVAYHCAAIDLATLTGTCRFNVLFPEPADGTNVSVNRTVVITNQSCAAQGL